MFAIHYVAKLAKIGVLGHLLPNFVMIKHEVFLDASFLNEQSQVNF